MEQVWSSTTKRTIAIGGVLILFFLINRISTVLPPVIITLILAYILSPIADFFSKHLRLHRTFVVVLMYLVLVTLLITLPALLIPSLITQIESFLEGLPEFIQAINEFIDQPVTVGDFTLDVQDVYEQASNTIEGFLSSLANQTIGILSNIASALFWSFFILVASFYLVKDAHLILRWIDEATPPDYRQDVHRLRMQVVATWNAFLRGQLILCVVMGLVVGITMAAIGLPYAWLIGLLFGVLEFIPNLGPTIASIPTVFIAFIQGSDVLHISNTWFAVVVVGVNTLLQQLENNFLVPRIMGQSLNLHPVVVLIAAIIGARLGGVLGILLAAPVTATLRVFVEYTYYRLLDLPPFPEQRQAIQVQAASAGEPKVDIVVSPSETAVRGAESKQAE